MINVTVEEEFKKNPELKEEDLKHIKDWLAKQPHLPRNIPDEMIILLMHSCYYNIEQSKQFIDTYYTLRTHLPEFFLNRLLHKDDIKNSFETINLNPLKKRTKEGYKVILSGLKKSDPQWFNFLDACKLLAMVGDAEILKDGTVPGVLFIVDFSGVKLGHVARLSLPIMKKLLTFVQEGTPVRLKGLHFINVVPFIDKVLALMKPFMKKELMDLLVLHSEGSDTIHKYVPKDIFPIEYGGKEGSVDELRASTYKLVQSFEQWYKDDECMKVDESKRPGKAKSAGELFGMDGSFRKLNID